jgi:hypothetical protein
VLHGWRITNDDAPSSTPSRAPLVVLLVAKSDERIAEVFEELAV